MTAVPNTKSNYRNLNGRALRVVEINGSRVSALAPSEFGIITVDFLRSEVELVAEPKGIGAGHE